MHQKGQFVWLAGSGGNTLRPRQNGRHFADDIFKCIFLNESVWIPIDISLKFVPKGPINNNPALVQIMAWRRSGDKPLSEPIMVRLPTHICVTRPQWVNSGQWDYTTVSVYPGHKDLLGVQFIAYLSHKRHVISYQLDHFFQQVVQLRFSGGRIHQMLWNSLAFCRSVLWNNVDSTKKHIQHYKSLKKLRRKPCLIW